MKKICLICLVAMGLLPVRAIPAEVDRLEDAIAQRKAFRKEVQALFTSGKYKELDRLANELRQTRARFSDGLPKLMIFYSSIEGIKKDTETANWETQIQRLEKWSAAEPSSTAARTLLGGAYIQSAWDARGGGWANTVTADGWKLMHEQLLKARSILEDVAKLPPQDPEPETLLIGVAQGLQLPYNEMDAYFQKAVQIDPAYYQAYFNKAYYLLPRWYGNPGDWEKFAGEAVEMTRAKEGESLYARIVWSLIRVDSAELTKDDQFYARNQISWPRLKKSFQDMNERYPRSLHNLSAFCDFACLAGDRETAHGLFQRLGQQIDLDVWKTAGGFHKWQLWANPQTPAWQLQPLVTLRAADALAGPPTLLQTISAAISGNSSAAGRAWPVAINTIALSPNGQRLAAGCEDGSIVVWDLPTGKVVAAFMAHDQRVNSVAFAANGRLLASCSGTDYVEKPQGEVKLWNTDKWTERDTLGQNQGPFHGIGFSPDSKVVAAAGGVYNQPAVIKIWNVETRKEELLPKALHYDARSLAFSPDGNLIAIGAWGEFAIWDRSTGRYADDSPYPYEQSGWVTGLAFSPDGTRLATATTSSITNEPGQVKIWQVPILPARVMEPITLLGDIGGVDAVVFSRDGKMVVTGSDDFTAKLWSLTSQKQTAAYLGHWNEVTAIALAPDGQTLMSASCDGTVKLWKMNPAAETNTSPPKETK